MKMPGAARTGRTTSQKVQCAIQAAERIRWMSGGDVATVPMIDGLIRRLHRIRRDVLVMEVTRDIR